MKIVVIGAGGRIGEKLVYNLRQEDCTVVEASPSFGVDTVTGAGLARASSGAGVVIDVSDPRHPRTGRLSASSRRRASISWLPAGPRASAITSPCRSWASSGF